MTVDRPLLSRVYHIALPAAGSFILGTLYAINDFFWAGHISSTALSAIGLCMMVLIFNYGLSAMVQKGVLSLVARLRGMQDHRGVALAAAQGLSLNLLCSIVILAAGWLLAPWVLRLMGGSGATLELAIHYLRLMYLGYPLMSMAAIVDGVFIGLGDTKTVFRLQLLGVTLNTTLNASAVLLFSTGISGIALASIASRFLSALVGIYIFRHRLAEGALRFPSRQQLRPRLDRWYEILRVGLPSSLSTLFYASIFMVLNRLLAQFGQQAFAVLGIGIRGIESIGFMVLVGFGAASSTISGEAIGKAAADHPEGMGVPEDQQQLKRILQPVYHAAGHSTLAALPVALLFTTLWLAIPEWLCRIYTSDPELIRLSAVYVRLAAIANLFQMVEVTLGDSLVGAGVSSWPLRVNLPGNLLRIPLAWALVEWTGLGMTAVWLAILASAVYKGIGLLITVRWMPWQAPALAAALALKRNPRST